MRRRHNLLELLIQTDNWSLSKLRCITQSFFFFFSHREVELSDLCAENALIDTNEQNRLGFDLLWRVNGLCCDKITNLGFGPAEDKINEFPLINLCCRLSESSASKEKDDKSLSLCRSAGTTNAVISLIDACSTRKRIGRDEQREEMEIYPR